MSRKIFVNLPVKDLEKAKAFYAGLGFTCNPHFTDETAASMVISEEIYVMLLTQEKFESFSPHPISDANKNTEVLLCLSCDSRAEVDATVKLALAAGGTVYHSRWTMVLCTDTALKTRMVTRGSWRIWIRRQYRVNAGFLPKH